MARGYSTSSGPVTTLRSVRCRAWLIGAPGRFLPCGDHASVCFAYEGWAACLRRRCMDRRMLTCCEHIRLGLGTKHDLIDLDSSGSDCGGFDPV